MKMLHRLQCQLKIILALLARLRYLQLDQASYEFATWLHLQIASFCYSFLFVYALFRTPWARYSEHFVFFVTQTIYSPSIPFMLALLSKYYPDDTICSVLSSFWKRMAIEGIHYSHLCVWIKMMISNFMKKGDSFKIWKFCFIVKYNNRKWYFMPTFQSLMYCWFCRKAKKKTLHRPAYLPFLCFFESLPYNKKGCKVRGLIKSFYRIFWLKCA